MKAGVSTVPRGKVRRPRRGRPSPGLSWYCNPGMERAVREIVAHFFPKPGLPPIHALMEPRTCRRDCWAVVSGLGLGLSPLQDGRHMLFRQKISPENE